MFPPYILEFSGRSFTVHADQTFNSLKMARIHGRKMFCILHVNIKKVCK